MEPSGDQSMDFALEVVEIERLVEHGARARCARIAVKLIVAERGHEHDRRGPTRTPKLSEKLETRRAGHAYIHDDEVRLGGAPFGDRARELTYGGTGRGIRDDVPRATKGRREQTTQLGVVFRNEDETHAGVKSKRRA
jgi:hypothetical protein